MKKKNFVSLLLGVVGGILFSVGMCMCLLPQWQSFNQGILLGSIGLAVLLVMLFVRRRMEHKPLIHVNAKIIGRVTLGLAGTLALGLGLCMATVWEGMLIPGVVVGIAGIVMLLALIPVCRGLRE